MLHKAVSRKSGAAAPPVQRLQSILSTRGSRFNHVAESHHPVLVGRRYIDERKDS